MPNVYKNRITIKPTFDINGAKAVAYLEKYKKSAEALVSNISAHNLCQSERPWIFNLEVTEQSMCNGYTLRFDTCSRTFRSEFERILVQLDGLSLISIDFDFTLELGLHRDAGHVEYRFDIISYSLSVYCEDMSNDRQFCYGVCGLNDEAVKEWEEYHANEEIVEVEKPYTRTININSKN